MLESNSIINLDSILDFSTKLNDAFDVQFILSSAMLSLMGKLKVAKVCSFLYENGSFHQVISKGTNEEFDTINFDSGEDFIKIPLDNYEYFPLIKAGYKYILALKHRNTTIALITLSESMLKRDFSEAEIEYAKIVGMVTVSSLANASNYEKLLIEKNIAERKNLLLSTLMEISQDFTNFSSEKQHQQILKRFSLHLMGQLLVNKYAIFQKENNHFIEIVNRFDKDVPPNFLNELNKIQGVTKSEDILTIIPSELESCCVAAIAPMKYRNELKGYVLIGKRLDNTPFTQENILFIEVLSNTLTGALENYRLFQEEIEKKKIENELNLALEIQRNLLPKESPKINGFDIYGISLPARTVGGDYFDFIKINESEHIIIIADVSGKGMPAALLMANLQAAIRTVAPLNLPLSSILQNINKLLYRNTGSDKFVTLFLAKINNIENSFEYINAGHNPPILFTSKLEKKELIEGGIVLGILPEVPKFGFEKMTLNTGDKILLYTDGISEAMNSQKHEFGCDRIDNFIISDKSMTAKNFAENLLIELNSFVGKAEQHDDITLITIIKK